MKQYTWNESYAIGDAIIDQQHQSLFSLANQILQTTDANVLVAKTMELYKHIREHFNHEEKFLKQVNYPYYDVHVKVHNTMLSKLNSISEQIHNKQITLSILESFMQQWINHITIDDVAARDYSIAIDQKD